MNFGKAIKAVKLGRRVARAGWNGRGMCVFLVTGEITEKELMLRNAVVGGVDGALFEVVESGPTVMPCLTMRAADGSHVMGWLASQTDILAEDWEEVA
ncbi:DUF2829 domain-containing protein [Paracoccus litorisediminis]|uniref:DUF2829 domain-containing protein n=1 Tax=Paracoccus litorisediminis TaxID=2006130 RepID=A0A844HPW5_9RHOB|nr:DUF2829 domain-containing protein [Paracoccus litorisediminis]MTH61179.1 DUF2829 domain-containing protein [Paracoccus litorisediminis]